MTKMNRFTYYAFLIFAALTLTACASKPKEEPVAEPVPAVAEQQPAPAPVTAQEAAPAPVEQAAPAPAPRKRVVKKTVKKPAPVEPKVVEPEPVVEPAPVAAPEPVVKEEPIVEPVQQVAEPGFLEKYWLWLLGLIVGVVAILWVAKKKE
ncbi:MAG TPA: hypothetical protein VGD24_05550 [Gallionella sp.]